MEILDELEAAGVAPLVLKGPALARLLYTSDEHRGYRDVDLLTSPADLPRARLALAKLGYADISAGRAVDDIAGVMHAETWLRSGEGAPRAIVDLHWRLAGWGASPRDVWAALDTHRTSVSIGGREIPVPERAALALHAATHAVQDGLHGHKAMADLSRAIDRWPADVWSSAARMAEQVGATLALAAGLRLLPAGETLARELELPYTDELTQLMLRDDARPRGTYHLEALTRARGIRERLNVIRRSLLPAPGWIAREYPWARGSKIRLLAGYARHLARTPAWALGALRFWRRTRSHRFREASPPSR